MEQQSTLCYHKFEFKMFKTATQQKSLAGEVWEKPDCLKY